MCKIAINRVKVTLSLLLGSLLLWSLASFARAQENGTVSEIGIDEILAAQIVANSSAVLVSTPSSAQQHLWSEDHGWQQKWNNSYSSYTVFLLVKIDQALIEAAVTQWSSGMNATQEQAQSARLDLLGRYMRADEDTFLFFAPPMITHPEWWAFELPSFQDNIRQRSFAGEFSPSSSGDSCSERLIGVQSSTFICLVRFPSRDETSEPYYYVETTVRHHIWSLNAADYIPANEDRTVEFRIEVGEVPLVQMVRRGVDWEQIRSTHLDTHVATIGAVQGSSAADFVLNVGVRVVSGLLLRGIRFR